MQNSPIKTARTVLRRKLANAPRSIGLYGLNAQAPHSRQVPPAPLNQQRSDQVSSTSSIETPVPPRNAAPQKASHHSVSAKSVNNTDQRKISFLRLKELQARIGLGRSAIYYLMDSNSPHHDKHFPRSVKISAHAVGWIESEIDAWLEARVRVGRN